MTTTDLPEIIDGSGQIRRKGSLIKPEGFVSTFATYKGTQPVLEDSDIKRIITDPNRIPSRVTFDKTWLIDQKSCGSCNGHAEANALARQRVRRGLAKILLSGPYAYSLMNGGRDNGSALEDGLKMVSLKGICRADLLQWNMIYPSLFPKGVDYDSEAAKHKGLIAYSLIGKSPAETRQNLRSALACGFDCIVAVNADNKFLKVNSTGVAGVDYGNGDHSVCIDDLRIVNGTEYFDMPNTWGGSYAIDGRAYLVWDHLSQTCLYHEFYAIGSTEEAGE